MKNIIKGILVTVVILFGILLFIFTNHIGGWRAFNVMSASMLPTLKTGSIVLTQYHHPSKLKNDDIITFIAPKKEKTFITHRIIDITHKDNLSIIKTKGDNNKSEDNWKLAGGSVVGKVMFNLPFLGYIMSFAQSKLGLLLFILLPAAYLIIDEIFTIFQTIKHHKKKNKAIQDTVTILLVFFTGIILFSPHSTYALLSDTASLTQNKFTVIIPQKNPILNLSFSTDKRALIFEVAEVDYFQSLDFLLTYKHGFSGITEGINGNENITGKSTFEKVIDLGTCSANSCIYHTSVRGVELLVTLTDRDGKTIILKGNLEGNEPDFPSCTEPVGKIIASYSTGKHEIIGVGLLNGRDIVYQLTEGSKTKVMQCYCSNTGQGIQTNWLKTTEIEKYRNLGWLYSVASGSSWNLDASVYVAQNIPYTCRQ